MVEEKSSGHELAEPNGNRLYDSLTVVFSGRLGAFEWTQFVVDSQRWRKTKCLQRP